MEKNEEESITLNNGIKLISSEEKSKDDIKIINLNMKTGREAFYRFDYSQFYEKLKLWIFGIFFGSIIFRLYLGFGCLYLYIVYLGFINFCTKFLGLNKNMRELLVHLVVKTGGRSTLYFFGILNYKIFNLSEEQMNNIIKNFPGRNEEEIKKFKKDNNIDENEIEEEENFEENFEKKNEENKKIFKKNYKNPFSKSPYILVCNHVAFTDVLAVMTYFRECSFIMKDTIKNIPFVGQISKDLKCIYITDKTKGKIIPEIVKRTKFYYSKKYYTSKLLIFPEATTSNGRYMLKFHDGAFVSGAPIQCCVVKYPYKFFNPAWCGMINHDFLYLCHLISQFFNICEISIFPPYYPSIIERNNPSLFAENVRKLMVEGSNLICKSIILKFGKEKFIRNYVEDKKKN